RAVRVLLVLGVAVLLVLGVAVLLVRRVAVAAVSVLRVGVVLPRPLGLARARRRCHGQDVLVGERPVAGRRLIHRSSPPPVVTASTRRVSRISATRERPLRTEPGPPRTASD